MESQQRIQHLEEAISFLENHIAEQDKEMLRLHKKVELLVQEFKKLQSRMDDDQDQEDLPIEKPPHY